MTEQQEKRLAMIPTIIENSPNRQIGRTALMKYMYFLQTLRQVPLGHRFTLYSYGPFDSTVLFDLSVAESLRAVSSNTVLYSGGYGYEISTDETAGWLKKRAGRFIHRHEKDIHWVMKKFGHLTSAQLELVSTIIYVDREIADQKNKSNLREISHKVHEIKPHFSESEIVHYAEELAKNRLLQTVH